MDLATYSEHQEAIASRLAPEVFEIWSDACYHIMRGGGEYREPWLEWREWDWLRLEETECPKWEPNYSDVFEPFKPFSDIHGYNVGSELLIKFPTFLGGGEFRYLDDQYSKVYYGTRKIEALAVVRDAVEKQIQRGASRISEIIDSIQSVLKVWFAEAVKSEDEVYIRHRARSIWKEILYGQQVEGRTSNHLRKYLLNAADEWTLVRHDDVRPNYTGILSYGVPDSLAVCQKRGIDYYLWKRDRLTDPLCKLEARRISLEYAIHYELLDKPMPKWSDVVAKKPSGREKHLENKDWVKDRFEKLAASGDFDSNDKIYRQVAEDYSYKFVKQISISQIQRYVGHRQ